MVRKLLKLSSLIVIAVLLVMLTGCPPKPDDELPKIIGVAEIANITVDFGTAFDDIGLPAKVQVTLDDDSTPELDVDWDEGDYDGSVPGTYTLYGDLVLTEGIENPDNLKASVNVIVKEEVAPPADLPEIVSFTVPGDPICAGHEFEVSADVKDADTVTFTFDGVEKVLTEAPYVATFTAPVVAANTLKNVKVTAENEEGSVSETAAVQILREDVLPPEIESVDVEVECGDEETTINVSVCDVNLDPNSWNWEISWEDENITYAGEIELVEYVVSACGYDFEFLWTFEDVDCVEVDLLFTISDYCGNESSEKVEGILIDNMKPVFWHDYEPTEDNCAATKTVFNWKIWENCLEGPEFYIHCDTVIRDFEATGEGFDEEVGRYYKEGTVTLGFTDFDFVDCTEYYLEITYADCHGEVLEELVIYKDLLDPRIRYFGFVSVQAFSRHFATEASWWLFWDDIQDLEGPVNLNDPTTWTTLPSVLDMMPDCADGTIYFVWAFEDDCPAIPSKIEYSTEWKQGATPVENHWIPGVVSGYQRVDVRKIDCEPVTAHLTVFDECSNSSEGLASIFIDNLPPRIDFEWTVPPECGENTAEMTLWVTDGSFTPDCATSTMEYLIPEWVAEWTYTDNVLGIELSSDPKPKYNGIDTWEIVTLWTFDDVHACSEDASATIVVWDKCCEDANKVEKTINFEIFDNVAPVINKFTVKNWEPGECINEVVFDWDITEGCLQELYIDYKITDICDASPTALTGRIDLPATNTGQFPWIPPLDCVTIDATLTAWDDCQKDTEFISFKYDSIDPELDLNITYNGVTWAGETIVASPCVTEITISGTMTENCCFPCDGQHLPALAEEPECRWAEKLIADLRAQIEKSGLEMIEGTCKWDYYKDGCTHSATARADFKFPITDATSTTLTLQIEDCCGNLSEKYVIDFLLEAGPYFEPTINGPFTTNFGDEATLTFEVENIGNEEGTQDITWTLYDPDGIVVVTDTDEDVELEQGEVWGPEDVTQLFDVRGTWTAKLETEDETAIHEILVEAEIVAVETLASIVVDYCTGFEDIDLPEQVKVELADDDFIDVDVEWDEGDYDCEEPGTYTLEGELVNLPEDVKNPDNLKAVIEVVVKGRIVVSVEELDPINVEYCSTSWSELLVMLPEEVEVTLSDDTVVEGVGVTWEQGDYDCEEPGTYTLEGELVLADLPLDVTNPDGVKAEIDVIVGAQPLYHVYEFVLEDLADYYVPDPSVMTGTNGWQDDYFADKTPVKLSIAIAEEKDLDYEGKVRVEAVGANDIELWAKDSQGNWYDINSAGWGPEGGFVIDLDAVTEVYVKALEPFEQTITMRLKDLETVTEDKYGYAGEYQEAPDRIISQKVEVKAIGPVYNETSKVSYWTIRDAVGAAKKDDVILVYPGVYNEGSDILDIRVAGLTLQAVEGPAETTIESGTIMIYSNGVTIDGFTIDNLDGARAIGPDGTDGVTIKNNIITNSVRGIQGDVYGRPTNLSIIGNTFETDYGVAGTEDITGLLIVDNTFDTPEEAIGVGEGVEIVDRDGDPLPPSSDASFLEAENTFINDGVVLDYRIDVVDWLLSGLNDRLMVEFSIPVTPDPEAEASLLVDGIKVAVEREIVPVAGTGDGFGNFTRYHIYFEDLDGDPFPIQVGEEYTWKISAGFRIPEPNLPKTGKGVASGAAAPGF